MNCTLELKNQEEDQDDSLRALAYLAIRRLNKGGEYIMKDIKSYFSNNEDVEKEETVISSLITATSLNEVDCIQFLTKDSMDIWKKCFTCKKVCLFLYI